MEIPHDRLSKEALTGLIEEFITREGTDYGERVYTLEQKVERVREQLRRGEVVISFDPDADSCDLRRAR